MTEQLQSFCDRFIRNRDIIKDEFHWESQYIIPVCACWLAEQGIDISAERLRECSRLIEKNTGVFSGFRSNATLPIAAVLAADSDPQKRFADTMAVFEALQKQFGKGSYTALVAAMISGLAPVEEAERITARGRSLFNMMRKAHPFLTDGEDSVFAVLMAFSEKDDNHLFEDMEECYSLMRKFAFDNNSAQGLSHVLALYAEPSVEKCERTKKLYELIVGRHTKYGKSYELGVLGALAMAAPDIAKAAEEVTEVTEFLAGQHGYTGFGIDKKTRAMHAAMLVSCLYSPNNASTAAITGTIAMIAAQNAALCAIIAVNAST